MRILSRYVFREVLSSSLLAVAVATFIVFLQGPGKDLLNVLVRTSATPLIVTQLFLLNLPQVMTLTIPFGILVGILVGLGRMASDGEITAMRAGGISSRSVTPPVVFFCLIAVAITAAFSLWLKPKAIQSGVRIVNRLYAEKLTADIQPRVFDESFPKKVLYVDDVRTGSPTLWEHVFMADLTPPEERNSSSGKPLEGPKVTIAQQAIPTPDVKHNRIQLTMRNVNAHETAKDGQGFHEAFPAGDQVLDATQQEEKKARAFQDMPTRELIQFVKTSDRHTDDGATSRVELHSRFALPLACLMLGLVGIPLGIQTRKGGKSAGYVTAILLAFLCYYLSFITLTSMARKHSMNAELATWMPNAIFGLVGVIFIARLEIPGDTDILGLIRSAIGAIAGLFNRKPTSKTFTSGTSHPIRWRFHFFQIVDIYILTEFLLYFSLWLASFVGMALIYNFFELLSDVIKNQIPLTKVFVFLFFLTPRLIYDLLPISVLVSVLVTFAILTKNNEVTAFKAGGVSVRRLGLPVLVMSMVLSAALFGFDYLYIPEANTKQDALRNEIKGKPVQTYQRKNQKWIFGNGSRIFYYRLFDDSQNLMSGVSVYELDPATFALKKEISAARAQWQPELNKWIFQEGWARDLQGTRETKFEAYAATTFPELNETPTWFIQEVKQDKQMNYIELQNYIHDLQQRGFDTVPLRVQLHKKFSVPIFAFIMALISVPFAFLVGNRGAMAGIGVSIAIAMTYLGIDKFFEQIGNVNSLSPAVAAWAPDALFALAGTYLLLRMRS
jgi:LPS export ABC transporter permease LptG/LPS export ABC transporter permease LptF